MSFLSRVTDFLGRGRIRALPVSDSAAIIPTVPLYEQINRIAGELTPARVSNIIRQADTGYVAPLIDLSNDCRQKDGHLQSVLGTRENALLGLDLVIPPWSARGEEPTDRDIEVAQFAEEAIKGATGVDQDIRSFDDTVAQQTGAAYLGFAVAGTVWDKQDGLIVPCGFRHYPQRRFQFRADDGRLVWQDGYGMSRGVDLTVEYPGMFLQHQPRINGDVPAREGLNKVLIWAALFRNWTTSDWMRLAELSWKPWRMGQYSKNASEKDKSDLMTVLQYLSTNGVALYREDHKIDIKWAEGSGGSSAGPSNHQKLCEYMGQEMSKATLGQTLTVEAGERGARSLGEVHDRVRKDIRESDARAIATTLRRDLVRWIVWMNFGPETPVPHVYWATDDAIDIESFSNGVKRLREAGTDVPQRWVWDRVGMPEPEEGEPMLGGGVWSVDVDVSDLDEDPDPENDTDEDDDSEEETQEEAA